VEDTSDPFMEPSIPSAGIEGGKYNNSRNCSKIQSAVIEESEGKKRYPKISPQGICAVMCAFVALCPVDGS
jgi:hypothetical protein